MDKILLVTPMMPPTPGGPATHAKKLHDHFKFQLFNFEKYRKLPSGIRHLCAFVEILMTSFDKKVIFALDGFTVALPSVIVGIILRKKVILRIGGDFIYENFLYIKEVNYEDYYNNFETYKKQFGVKLYIKYLVQKFISQYAYGIVFNTEWQKEIFRKHYELQNSKLYVVVNPIEEIKEDIYKNEFVEDCGSYLFTSITRDIPYKNQKRIKEAIREAKGIFSEIQYDNKQGSWESCLKRISLSRGYICASISDISPNQALEALSLKVPVIISKYTGITEMIEKNKLGIVIDPFNIDEIKDAILALCNKETYEMYKANLNNFVLKETWATYFAENERILKEVGNI